jgi:hypothetical protein
MVLYGLAREPLTALAASVIAGASWIAALATLSVSAQVALPDWVRGRGLALYTTVFFGCLTLGSAAWGEIAVWVGLPIAHFLAAAGIDLALEASDRTWRRSFPIDALASTDNHPKHRQRSRPGAGDGGVPHRPRKPTGIHKSDGQT